MLVATLKNQPVMASHAVPSERHRYRCPCCGAPVVFRSGTRRVWHFAHHAHSTCAMAGETIAHMTGKQKLYELLVHSGANDVCVEAAFHGINRRADVYARVPGAGPVVFEVQRSGMDVREVEARTQAYASVGAAVVWVPVIKGFDLSNASHNQLFCTRDGMPETRDLRLTDWQVLMLAHHSRDALVLAGGGGDWNLAAIRFWRCWRDGYDGYNSEGEPVSSSGHRLANTFEGPCLQLSDTAILTIEIKRRKEWARYDHKKAFDIEAMLGVQAPRLAVHDRCGIEAAKHRYTIGAGVGAVV